MSGFDGLGRHLEDDPRQRAQAELALSLPSSIPSGRASTPSASVLHADLVIGVEKYLGCGDLRLGFARVVCRDCRHEAVVGVSCKHRGFCPSCTARRAHEAPAHLVDSVVPRVPVRQWVLSFPKALRYVLAREVAKVEFFPLNSPLPLRELEL